MFADSHTLLNLRSKVLNKAREHCFDLWSLNSYMHRSPTILVGSLVLLSAIVGFLGTRWNGYYENAIWVSFVTGAIGFGILLLGLRDRLHGRDTDPFGTETLIGVPTRRSVRRLVRVGVCIVAAGIFLYWSALAWNDSYYFDYLVPGVIAWFCLSLIGAVGLLVVNAPFRGLATRRHSASKLSIVPGLPLRNVLPSTRHRPIPVIAQLPNFGLICGFVLWVLIFLFMIIEGQHRCQGLAVDFKGGDSINWTKSPWAETLSVYLAVGQKYYVNNKPVKKAALRETLQVELSRRTAWTVYFEADNDTLYMDAIYAMDVVQGLGAKLVWVTPKTRRELERKLREGARPSPD